MDREIAFDADRSGEMPIEGVVVRSLSAPLGEPVQMSFAGLQHRALSMVEVHAGGLVGYGESWVNHPRWAGVERLATLHRGVAPLLLGSDARDVEGIHGLLVRQLLPLGRQWGAPGPIWQAISAVDQALWDLRGKAMGRSIAALLSDAPRSKVPVYASGVGPDRVVELTEDALDLGVRAVKVRVGFGLERDRETLHTAREVAGEDVMLFADANQAWSMDEAVEYAALLATYDVQLIEEPLRGNVAAELDRLGEAIGIPVATGENAYGPEEFGSLAASSAVSVLQPDVSKSGGITSMVETCETAEQHGKQVYPHCYSGAITLAASLQVAAALPVADMVELDVRENPLRTSLLTRPWKFDAGCLVIPDGPGLGIELDEGVAEIFETHREVCGDVPNRPASTGARTRTWQERAALGISNEPSRRET